MADTTPSGTYEERPKPNWFLWVAAAFFLILVLAVVELENSVMKWAWLGIASLNLAANGIQISNTMRTRYVLWKRGLSIYVGNTREALVRFDKALMFRAFKNSKDAQVDMREFGAVGPLRSFPTFGGRRRWLVIYEREDGVVQGLVFDPTPTLESMFRRQLIKAEEAQSAAAEIDAGTATADDAWTEEQEEPKPPQER